MNSQPLISLCMPTNGVTEWVFPSLESIYSQGIDTSLFEIIITDNGKNDEFKQKMRVYLAEHDNIIYEETDALPFINEIEAYKRASGKFLKFINHRTLLFEGALDKLIRFVQNNENERPVVYFSNGVLSIEKRQHKYSSFDQFVRNLSYFSSWSGGMSIWKEDFDKLPEDVSGFNELFPHTNVLFNERNRKKYIIDNSVIFAEIPQGDKPKGNYDLFFAFGIEYVWIICNLLRDKDITADTFRYVADKNLGFIAELYLDFCICKKYCSYDLSGLDNMYGVFYGRLKFARKVIYIAVRKIVMAILRMLHEIHNKVTGREKKL